MTTNNNVRFTFQDDDETESVMHQQDPAELHKLKEMSLNQSTFGTSGASNRQSLAFESPTLSRATSTNPVTSATASRRSSKADIHSRPHSRIHTPDISPPATPQGDPGL